MEYCAPVWASKDITKLEKVQSRAARWVCARWNRQSFSWDKSYQQCCIELNWLTLETRRDFYTCCQVYRSLNNLDCIPFSTYFSFNTEIFECIHPLEGYVDNVISTNATYSRPHMQFTIIVDLYWFFIHYQRHIFSTTHAIYYYCRPILIFHTLQVYSISA